MHGKRLPLVVATVKFSVSLAVPLNVYTFDCVTALMAPVMVWSKSIFMGLAGSFVRCRKRL